MAAANRLGLLALTKLQPLFTVLSLFMVFFSRILSCIIEIGFRTPVQSSSSQHAFRVTVP